MEKEWKKPQMVVVVRGSTEESVLVVCKNDETQGTPITSNFSCRVDECADCNSRTSS